MFRKTIFAIALVVSVLTVPACAGQTAPVGNTQQPAASQPATVTQTSAAPQQAASVPAPAPAPKPAGPIKASEITPVASGDTVFVPLNLVKSNWNSHFMVPIKGSSMGFMAYVLNDEVSVRASVCPPCRGKTYTLSGDILVCDMCATTFNAKTGIGIKGACVDYPKASVPYTVSEGNIVMKLSDLQLAYENTLKSGLP